MRFVLALTLFALGCLPPISATGGTVIGGGGDSTFLVRNESSEVICYVNLVPEESEFWGPDRLGSEEVVVQGESRGWRMPPGTYDLRLQDCNRDVLLQRRGIDVQSQGALLSFRRRE